MGGHGGKEGAASRTRMKGRGGGGEGLFDNVPVADMCGK